MAGVSDLSVSPAWLRLSIHGSIKCSSLASGRTASIAGILTRNRSAMNHWRTFDTDIVVPLRLPPLAGGFASGSSKGRFARSYGRHTAAGCARPGSERREHHRVRPPVRLEAPSTVQRLRRSCPKTVKIENTWTWARWCCGTCGLTRRWRGCQRTSCIV
jgi:hypothetical protein